MLAHWDELADLSPCQRRRRAPRPCGATQWNHLGRGRGGRAATRSWSAFYAGSCSLIVIRLPPISH